MHAYLHTSIYPYTHTDTSMDTYAHTYIYTCKHTHTHAKEEWANYTRCKIYEPMQNMNQAVSASLEQILSMLQPPPGHMLVVPPPSTTSLPVNKGLHQTTESFNDIKITYVSEVEPR